MFDERDLAEISSPEFPGERLIVCRNPVLAEQRWRKRQELLAATEVKLAAIVKATQRAKEPLRGAADIGVRVGKVINQHKVGKHFLTTIADDSFSFARDLEKIAAEEELDGLYIVRSNVEPELFDAEQTVQAYKDLAKVERAFRSMKTVDLKVRPIYHRRADRVRAHVLLCMLAYYLECAVRWLRCCSTTTTAQLASSNGRRWCNRRSGRRRHRRRRPASAPRMICRCTVFAA